MKTNDFCKVGTDERKDVLTCIGKKNWMLCYGYSKNDEGQGYEWRKTYDHQPSEEEVKSDLIKLIDQITDDKILNSFKWNDMPVYLSSENQMNFKAAYDLAVQSADSILPITFKLGEDENSSPVYHVFSDIDDFSDFYLKAISFINSCLKEGWQEKDSIDYNSLLN